jgi:hypothetical protein
MAGLLPRLQYLCDRDFGGNISAFARAVKVTRPAMHDIVRGKTTPKMSVLIRLVRGGFVNAEWLLCGTGPINPADPAETPPELFLPRQLDSAHGFLDTSTVQYALPTQVAQVPELDDGAITEAALAHARVIHAARSNSRPVVLFLGHESIEQNAGPVVVELMKRGYVTGVAMTTAAAMRDFERAIFGGYRNNGDRLAQLAELNRAALRGAQAGTGYGEVLGRWCFPVTSERASSVLATAYELHLPATVHLALGDSAPHFFPANRGAELGAALGAVSYVDMLVFADQVRQMAGTPSGVFLAAERGAHGSRLFSNALEAVHSSTRAHVNDSTLAVISKEYRHTFPALLTACDAVYDGSADDHRLRRK